MSETQALPAGSVPAETVPASELARRIGRLAGPTALIAVLQAVGQLIETWLAARQGIAEAFHDIFAEWVRARPDVAIEVSVMPALELHKAKLLLAAGAHRLPDVASVDSFWMPLFREGGHVQPLDPEWTGEERADFMARLERAMHALAEECRAPGWD